MGGCPTSIPRPNELFPDIGQRGADHPWLANWQAVAEACRTGQAPSDRDVTVGGRVYHQAIHFMPQTGRIRTYGFDIAERKQAEEESQAARASAEQAKATAELANRAKDHFLAVLSHELRTPLTPVVMGISMLQDRADFSSEVRDTLDMVRRNVEMEARLIDDLLDVMRIARGKSNSTGAPSNYVPSSTGRSRSASPISRRGGCISAWTWGRPPLTGSRPTSPGSNKSSGIS